MKKMRRLIPAIAMLLVSAVMLSTASFAWFTISTSTQVSGMEVTATAGSSLLIIDAKPGNIEASSFAEANGILTLTGVQNPLIPATSVNGTMMTIDASLVDPSTGYIMAEKKTEKKDEAGETVTDAEGNVVYETVTDAEGNVVYEPVKGTDVLTATGVTETANYYYDYKVAIGSAGAPVTGALTATIDVDSFSKILHNAVSIDFLLSTTTTAVAEDGTRTTTTTADAYIGKVHFANSANGSTNLTQSFGNVTIPLTLEDEQLGGYITVTMRVYFDGALENAAEPGTTYVRNYYATEEPVGFGVKFDIVPANNNQQGN